MPKNISILYHWEGVSQIILQSGDLHKVLYRA
jgi:hypothetical protein